MKHCNLCGRAVDVGHYRVFTRERGPSSRGLTVCADCERTKPRCAVCQTPMPEERTALRVCVSCFREGLRCRACGKRIRGAFVFLDGNDGPYCDTCHHTLAACDLCGAPAGEGASALADGRILCRRCHQTAVRDPRQVQILFHQVVDILANTFALHLFVRPRLVLVDHTRLVELSRTAAAEDGGNGENVLGLFVRQGQRRVIYLQECLPRILVIQVIAHEYAHAWLGEKCPLLRDPFLREGFAEWVAYRVLLRLDARKKGEQMLRRQDHYGKGLRFLLDIEEKHDAAHVLQYCQAAQANEIRNTSVS